MYAIVFGFYSTSVLYTYSVLSHKVYAFMNLLIKINLLLFYQGSIHILGSIPPKTISNRALIHGNFKHIHYRFQANKISFKQI